MIGEDIAAHAPNQFHSHRIPTQLAGRASLIRSFSARNHPEIAAQHSLARRWQTRHRHYEIHVETAHDHNGGFHLPRQVDAELLQFFGIIALLQQIPFFAALRNLALLRADLVAGGAVHFFLYG
jgi:hypothetical protein